MNETISKLNQKNESLEKENRALNQKFISQFSAQANQISNLQEIISKIIDNKKWI